MTPHSLDRQTVAKFWSWVAAVLILPAAVLAAEPAATNAPASSILVALKFDDNIVETGPDTLTVFQHAKGTVQLSSAFRWDGRYSVEIHDEPGDHDFPELFGRFPLRRTGWLVVHFALLVATPNENFNVALAGPQRFLVRPDGISFWLQARDGYLLAVSYGLPPQRLFALRAFTWYFVDVDLNLDSGQYNLAISEEGNPKRLVDLQEQPNAPGHAGSAVEVFSFIGDLEDVSRVTYYVDDIVIGTDKTVRQPSFVAPGRRRLFVDSLSDLRRFEDGSLSCMPFLSPSDLGLSAQDVASLQARGRFESLLQVLTGSSAATAPASGLERALSLWRDGCQALQRGEAERAAAQFQSAERTAPGAPLLVMAEALGQIALGHSAAAATAIARLSEGADDPRRAVLEALLLARDGAWGSAEARVAPATAGERPNALLASARYHLQLWQGRFNEARIAALAESAAAPETTARTLWQERAGDAAFLAGDLAGAEQLYQAALATGAHPQPLLCRLADIRFQRGDLAGERALRERVFGSLRFVRSGDERTPGP